MTDATIAIALLRQWRARLPAATGFDRVHAFGSVVYRGGAQFVARESDIDLLVQFSYEISTPGARAEALSSLVPQVQLLESDLVAVGLGGSDKPIVSATALTAFEESNNIHKDNKHGFWRTGCFTDLKTGDSCDLARPHAETFQARFAHAVQTLRDVQRFRNEFLRVSANGSRALKDFDGKDALPKNICRSAAGLRCFAQNTSEESAADVNQGAMFLQPLVSGATDHPLLFDHVMARINRGVEHPLSVNDQLLLWEILADAAVAAIGDAEMAARAAPRWRPGLGTLSPSEAMAPDPEGSFLALAAGPSLRIGEVSLACKLFPLSQWSSAVPEAFEDDPESERYLRLTSTQQLLPTDLLDNLVAEMREAVETGSERAAADSIKEAYERLTTEGSNAYPRLVASPQIATDGDRRVLDVFVGPSRYGVALVEERRLPLASAERLRGRFILNSLAVRVAYLSQMDSEWWVEFHQRRATRNATWPDAWDIGAAGYIDEHAHRDPEDNSRISPWQTAAHELAEELGLAGHQLPHRDKYIFFGIGRNDATGQLDILGCCKGIAAPRPDRPTTSRVAAFGRCRLSPREVAEFVASRRSWVPTALLTAILTLRHFGFESSEIETAFGSLAGRVSFQP